MRMRAVPSSAMMTPHAAPLVFGQHTTWAGFAQQLPAGWDASPVQIAEITVDRLTVITPYGPIDRSAARWSLGSRVPWHESTPSWATAGAILLIPFTFFLSLLFLLIKETDVWTSPLTVTDGRVTFNTTVYSRNTTQYEAVRAAIAWAQSAPGPPSNSGQMALPS